MIDGLPVIVLAAGKGARFGGPKQLAYFKNRRLLSIALERARNISEEVVVVTGAYANEISTELQSELESLGVQNVYNPDWESGMGSSIKAGVSSLNSSAEGVMILLADQPLVTESHLKSLVEVWCGENRELGERPWAVATSYSFCSRSCSSLGVPALFDKRAFGDLRQIRGDKGARYLLQAGPEKVVSIQPDFSLMDIDTPEQLTEAP